jgi:hypothetical protein
MITTDLAMGETKLFSFCCIKDLEFITKKVSIDGVSEAGNDHTLFCIALIGGLQKVARDLLKTYK